MRSDSRLIYDPYHKKWQVENPIASLCKQSLISEMDYKKRIILRESHLITKEYTESNFDKKKKEYTLIIAKLLKFYIC